MNYEENLLKAIKNGDDKKIKYLVEKKNVPVNFVGFLGEMPILTAIDQTYNIRPLKLLVELGAEINILNKYGQNPVFRCIDKENLEALDFLIQNKVILNFQHKISGDTPLIYAIKEKKSYFMDMLIKGGADVNLENKRKKTALHYAVERKSLEIVKLLTDAYKADVNKKDEQGKTPLFYAVINESKEMVEHLVKKARAKVNLTDKEGKTPLFYALQTKNDQIFNLLLSFGAKIHLDRKNKKSVEQYLEEELLKDPLVLMYQKVLEMKQGRSLKPIHVLNQIAKRRAQKGGRSRD